MQKDLDWECQLRLCLYIFTKSMVSPVWCVWWAETVFIHHYKELGVTCVVRVVG